MAAVRQLATAMRRFYAVGVPLDPGQNIDAPPAWTAEQVRAVITVRDAWVRLAETRRVYDQARPQLTRGEMPGKPLEPLAGRRRPRSTPGDLGR